MATGFFQNKILIVFVRLDKGKAVAENVATGGGCVITTEGVMLEKKWPDHRIGRCWDGRNLGSTAQPPFGFPETSPSAIVHAVPEFIRGMSEKIAIVDASSEVI